LGDNRRGLHPAKHRETEGREATWVMLRDLYVFEPQTTVGD